MKKTKKIKVHPKREALVKFANIVANIYWNKPNFFDTQDDKKIRRELKKLIGYEIKHEISERGK